MKTIFLTIFQGVEAKNVMRSTILEELLKQSDWRIVLFTKSRERAEFYEKEFNNPRLIYEVVEYKEPKGIDALFSKLKFTLLKTPTTDLQRRMLFELTSNYWSYVIGRLFNFILARPLFRKFARFLDYILVRSAIYSSYFETYKPDLVFMLHLFDDPEVHLLREAKIRGVKTIGMVNSWDKVTSRCILRLLPDRVVVFNDIVKDEMIRYNEVAEKDIFVGGIPQYDIYFKEAPDCREEFFKKLGIDPVKKLIVFGTMGKTFSSSDWDMIDYLEELRRSGAIKYGVSLLVRFLPYDALEEVELKKRSWLTYDYPGVRFSSKRKGGTDWDMDMEEINHLHDTLRYMSLLICYASSLSIEAAIFDKPIINLNFELKEKEYLIKSPTQYFKTDHYSKALQSGGIRLVQSKNELIQWINRYLENSSLDNEARKRFVEKQCAFLDGRSGERIVRFLTEQIM